MVEFLRGLHCPVCRAHPAELDRRVDELSARGIDVIAVSAETCERPERLLADWKLERPPSPSVSLNHRCESGGCWSRGDGATTNRRSSTSRGFSSLSPDGKVYYESILSMPASQPEPASRPAAARRPAPCHRLLDQGRLSRSRRRPTVGDTRARSTQKGRVLHRDISAIRLSGEHDRRQAGHPKWRNQPIERPRRRTARRLVRPVRAGSARRRSGQVPSRGALTHRGGLRRARGGS